MDLNHLPHPTRRSMTRRRSAAADARKQLAAYLSRITDNGREDVRAKRLMNLLWAQAFIEQALAQETSGRLGNIYATPARIVGEDIIVGGALAGVAARAADGRTIPVRVNER